MVGVHALVAHAAHHLAGDRARRVAKQAGQIDLLDDVARETGDVGAGDDPVDVDPVHGVVEVDAVDDADDVDLVHECVEVEAAGDGGEVDAGGGAGDQVGRGHV